MKTRIPETRCPVALATRVMGGKWKARIIWTLQNKAPLRFSDLRRALPPISDRILSHELKELEGWDVVCREQIERVPPHTEYRLSEFGATLEPVMSAMSNWAIAHRSKLTKGEPDE